MADNYDIQGIINDLKEKEEMDPDKHDGCYELMRETIEAYSKLDDISVLDFSDLNLVYLTTVGTFRQGLDAKKKTVNESHLLPDDKEYLIINKYGEEIYCYDRIREELKIARCDEIKLLFKFRYDCHLSNYITTLKL